MESHLQRTHDHQEDPRQHAGLQPMAEGEGEAEHHHNHHGEKKSMLTKVKDKAKKIKDKIKHAGHAHEGDDYDYDEDEEIVNASHVHDAPVVNESEFISGTALPKQTGLNLENPTALPKGTGPNLENPANPLEDRQSRIGRDDVYDDLGNVGAGMASDRHARNDMDSSVGNDQVMESSPSLEDPSIPNTRKADYSGAGDVGEITAGLATEATRTNPPPANFDLNQRADVAEPTVKISPLGGDLEEDHHFSETRLPNPSNYQNKVADPTGQGGAEVDVVPLVDRLDNLHVGDESEHRKTEPDVGDESEHRKTEPEEMDYTGSHDQCAPQSIPTSEQFTPKSLDDEAMPPRDTVAESAPTSVIAEKASSAKDMVASKLGYGHGGSGQDNQTEEPTQKGALGSVSEYGQVVVEKLAPVYEKAAGAGSAIMSMMQRGGSEGAGAGAEGVAKGSDRGVSVQEYLVEKFSPGEEDRELSKVISSAIQGEGKQQKEVSSTIRGEGQQLQQPQAEVKESVTVEAAVSDEKAATGVVDRVKGAIGSWLGKNPPGDTGEGLEKETASNLQE